MSPYQVPRYGTIVAALALIACQSDELSSVRSVEIGTRQVVSYTDGAALPFSKTYTRATGAPAPDTVTLTALEQLLTEEITVRVRNGVRRATGGTVTVGGVEVIGESDYPFTEKVMKVNIGTVRPVRVISRIAGTPGGEYTVIVESGSPVSQAGGTVEVAGGDVKIDVPAGALTQDIAIAAEPIETPQDPGNFGAYDFGPDGTTFEKPITLTFPIPTVPMPAGSTPGLYWRQTEGDEWRPLANPQFDAEAGTVSGDISHFTQIGIRTRAIRVCPTGIATATVAEAVAQVAREGEVILCDATHAVNGVAIGKPMTITSEPGVLARIVSTAPSAFTVNGIANGTARFSRLAFTVSTQAGYGVSASGTYDQLVVDSSTFALSLAPAVANGAVFAGASTVNSATFAAFGNEVTGGSFGLHIQGTPFVSIRDNQIDGQNDYNIRLQAGNGAPASGEIARNRMSNCGVIACVEVNSVAGLRVDSNTVTAERRTYPSGTIGGQYAIAVRGGAVTVRGNSIVGLNLPADLNNIFAFPFNQGLIFLESAPQLATTATVVDNYLEGGLRGVLVNWPQTAPEPVVSGRDNRINKVAGPFEARGGSRMTFTNNDITNVVQGVVHSGLSAANRPPGLRIGDLSCNYWGASTYAAGMSNSLVPHGVYLPAASAPTAGTSGVGCTPTPVLPAAATRVCSTPDVTAAVPQFTNVWWAVASTADNGTVTFCPGTYNSTGMVLTRPMTIQGEPGGPRPVLDGRATADGTAGGAVAFIIGLTAPGTITIRNLEFIRSRINAIAINGNYDRVVIEDNLFRPLINQASTTKVGDATIGYWSGVTMGSSIRTVSGNGVVVRNNDFLGGDIGVLAFGNTDLTVQNNRFSGQRNAGFHGGDGTASNNKLIGNSFSDCGRAWCVGVFQDKSPQIRANVFLVAHKPGRTNNVIQVNGDSVVVAGNVITGTGGTMINGDSESWPAAVGMNVRGRIALVTGNTIEAVQGGLYTAAGRLVFSDNRMDRMRQLLALGTNDVSIRRNDFTNYVSPVFLTGLTATAGSFGCNWWGSTSGPTVAADGFTLASYSPFATAPIAGTNDTCP